MFEYQWIKIIQVQFHMHEIGFYILSATNKLFYMSVDKTAYKVKWLMKFS